MDIWSSDTPFCPQCGSLLLFPDYGDVKCDRCPFTIGMVQLPKSQSITQSFPKPPPEWLLEYNELQAEKAGFKADAKVSKHATVKEECPKCKNPEMLFYTMQLRSADEGQTVFYECQKCTHKFSVNT